MSLRSPIGRARGLGAAHDGTGHWWAQRLTAIALIPLTFVLVAVIAAAQGLDRAGFAALMGEPVVAIGMLLLVIAGFHHLRLGVQVVIEDYVHHEGLKTAGLIALSLGAYGLAVAVAFAILKLAFLGAS